MKRTLRRDTGELVEVLSESLKLAFSRTEHLLTERAWVVCEYDVRQLLAHAYLQGAADAGTVFADNATLEGSSWGDTGGTDK